ncbi:MAG: hypothetical protein JSS21_05065 [Proteobacteria bacterium]|nr:hypothetical protein [Pseudomonadota bacterium]
MDGEPDASEIPGREAEECFAPALRFLLDAKGQPTTARTEPIAADARPGKDGKANAKLKLIAGMLDVGFDQLKQREQQRRVRRMTAIAALATLVMAVTIVLSVFAMISRHQAVIAQAAAERRQKQAEGLVGFMLGDLNDKLDQVHRLDIMQAVDEKAMAYFDALPAADATDDALALRVQALQKIGMVMTEAHGKLAEATRSYETAAALAAELARRAPQDVNRQSAWADSLNMVGVAYWGQSDLGNALTYFRRASALLQKTHAVKPDDAKITNSLAGIRGNIGHVLESRGDLAGAQTEYEAELKLYQLLATRDLAQQSNVAWSWDDLGKLSLERGELDRALTDYSAEHRIKQKLASVSPQNHVAQDDLMVCDAILGRTLAWGGETNAGLYFSNQAIAQARALLAFDPTNTDWQFKYALYNQQEGGLLRQLDRPDEARDAVAQAVQILTALLKKDPISGDFQRYLSQAQLENARLQLTHNNIPAAAVSTKAAFGIIENLRTKAPDDRSSLLLEAQAQLLLGQIAAQSSATTDALRMWTRARDLLQPALRSGDDPNFLAAYVEALLRLDQTDAARPVIAKLNAMGYRTPDFVSLLANSHIDYPPNTAFQQRIAQLMRTGVAQGEAGSTNAVATEKRDRAQTGAEPETASH